MIKKLLDFYLYSSLHIALCAMALVAYSYELYRIEIDYAYLLFVGAGTMLTYSLHRLVGIRRMGRFSKEGRFAVVKEYQSHIGVYAVLSFIACLLLYGRFGLRTQLYLAAAAMVSISYTLPVFGAGRRLRDFAFIKIFMIAAVWAFVTETIPLLSAGEVDISNQYLILAFVERFFYFLAITIPFDIRDLAVDQDSHVQTLPSKLGSSKSLAVGYLALIIATSITLVYRSLDDSLPLLLCYAVSSVIIYMSHEKEEDFWYSGLLDGTMLLPLVASLFLP